MMSSAPLKIIFISRSPKKYKKELISSIFRRPGIFRRRLKMAAESWCVQSSAVGSSTSQLYYIFGGPKWKPPFATASAVRKFSSRLIIRASHEPLDDRKNKFYKELGMFSLRKRIEDSILCAELLAPTALEHEEARHVKQEEISRDHDLWDDLGKSNEILIKLADSAKVVDALKDLKYKVEEAKLITELAELDTVNYELFKQAYFASVDLNKFLDKYEMSKFLEEPYDMEGACLIIESRCGDFCSETWAGQLTRMYMKWAEKQGHAVRLVERCPAKNGGIKLATIEFEFKYAYGYLSGERGVHQIIGNHKSEFNSPEASLAAVDVIPLFFESSPGLLIDDKDLLVSCPSSSKKPGKISSLVSIQHTPTGVEVQSTGERSRVANKIKALNCLKAKLLVILRDQRTSDVSNINKDDLVDMWSHEARRLQRHVATSISSARHIFWRNMGIPAKGTKQELVSALKSSLNSQIDGEGSLHRSNQVITEDEPNITKINSKRKSKLSTSKLVQVTDDDLEVSGTKRTKRSVKQSPVDTFDVKTLQNTTEQDLKIESIDVEDKTYIQAKRKVSSRITSAKFKALDSVELAIEEPWTIFAHKKPQKGWIAYNPKTMRPPPLAADTAHLKLMSWNVNGLRALLKLESFSVLQLAQRENFDILCLQETKLQEKDVQSIKQSLLEGYNNSFWTCSVSKLGYSGTAIISRMKPLSVRYGLGISDHDSEGRLVTVEFDNFYLLSGYVPNSGDGLRRLSYRISQWDPSLSDYMKDLERLKPVILTGDLNCAHQEIDIYNPAGNRRSAGFTDEERKSFQTNFLDKGFVDTFRKQHPDVVGYTYWGYRHGARKTNRGWRLDYFLVSESISDMVHDSYILPDITGSDHSPIGLILKL